MSYRLSRLRARLDRLSRSVARTAADGDRGPDFPIDPIFAASLRNDYVRHGHLWRENFSARHSREAVLKTGVTAAEIEADLEEEHRLDASIKERARTIVCVEGYGLKQADRDEGRVEQFRF